MKNKFIWTCAHKCIVFVSKIHFFLGFGMFGINSDHWIKFGTSKTTPKYFKITYKMLIIFNGVD